MDRTSIAAWESGSGAGLFMEHSISGAQSGAKISSTRSVVIVFDFPAPTPESRTGALHAVRYEVAHN
jgi:hypothetical protein